MKYMKSLLAVTLLAISTMTFADQPMAFTATGCVKKGMLFLQDGKELGTTYKVGERINLRPGTDLSSYEGYLIQFFGEFERDKAGAVHFSGRFIELPKKVKC